MGKSTALANAIADHILGGPDYVRVATVYYALFSADPMPSQGVSNELAYGGYARVAKTNNATNFPAAVAGLKSNGVVVQFPTHDGTTGDEDATHFGIFDSLSGGVFLAGGELDTTYNIDELDAPKFEPGTMTWTEE